MYKRRRFAWFSVGAPSRHSARPASITDASSVPFLGRLQESSATELIWQQQFSPFELAFLQGHRVGKVKLLPGTCYIEIARAVVRERHGETPFALLDVRFKTIMFLDECDQSGAPTVQLRLSLDTSEVSIVSRLEEGAWEENAVMRLALLSIEMAAPLDTALVRTRCPERVAGDEFYAKTGNNYQGEFRALAEGWGGGGVGEALGRIEYGRAETQRLHLRSCAWLDTCTHAPVWWSDHRMRPFFAKAVRSYHILTADVSNNRELWGHHTLDTADAGQPVGLLQFYDGALKPMVRIEGAMAGFFEVGRLEGLRYKRRQYVAA
jgi:acyl transferase domain-containing protein